MIRLDHDENKAFITAKQRLEEPCTSPFLRSHSALPAGALGSVQATVP